MPLGQTAAAAAVRVEAMLMRSRTRRLGRELVLLIHYGILHRRVNLPSPTEGLPAAAALTACSGFLTLSSDDERTCVGQSIGRLYSHNEKVKC